MTGRDAASTHAHAIHQEETTMPRTRSKAFVVALTGAEPLGAGGRLLQRVTSRPNRRRRIPVMATAFVLVAACGSAPTVPSSTTSAVASTGPAVTPAQATTPIAAPSLAPTLSPAQMPAGSWVPTGSMTRSHTYGATATLLQDGRVLVAGGEVESDGDASSAADLYDPTTGQWTPTGRMRTARRGHIATLLADGRVLVAGGWSYHDHPVEPPRFAELFDPATGTWSEAGSMTRWRYSPLATLLLDGRVLVARRHISGGGMTRGAEVYDPATNAWRSTRTMAEPPGSATRLADGRVLVMHGAERPELFDPVSGRWSWAAKPPASGAQALVLDSGEALVMEGNPDGIGGAELYDPTSDTWTQTGSPETGRGPATLLADGTVLLVGRSDQHATTHEPACGRPSPGPRSSGTTRSPARTGSRCTSSSSWPTDGSWPRRTNRPRSSTERRVVRNGAEARSHSSISRTRHSIPNGFEAARPNGTPYSASAAT